MSPDDGERGVDVDACLSDEQQDVVQLYVTFRYKLQLPHLYHAHHHCHSGNTGKTIAILNISITRDLFDFSYLLGL